MYTVETPSWKSDANMKSGWHVYRNHTVLYVSAIVILALIRQTFNDIGLSTLLTVSVIIQVIALTALLLGILSRKSVHGISFKSFAMQAFSYGCRLCSTCWLKGYIPVDSTGDWLYQVGDFTAMALCLCICYAIERQFASTSSGEADSFPARNTCLVCVALALVIHPDLNNRKLFDALWTASLYVDVVSTLPQLWLIGKQGGKVDSLSAHYIALVAIARGVDMFFWYHGYEELAPDDGGFNLAGWVVLGAHATHLLLMADFIYCYALALYRGRLLDKELDFGVMLDV